ncbi:hypothetical protein [Methylobacterium radiotolerans]|uniref:hypothetical protein n=1 Tax=Methylobacterium radiotolerans TaxID=31998 RepID=UPI0038D0E8E3
MIEGIISPKKYDRAFGDSLLRQGRVVEAERWGGSDPWGRLDRIEAYIALASDLVEAGLLEDSVTLIAGVPFFDLTWLQSLVLRPELADSIAPSIRRYLADLNEGTSSRDLTSRPSQHMYDLHAVGVMEVVKWALPADPPSRTVAMVLPGER